MEPSLLAELYTSTSLLVPRGTATFKEPWVTCGVQTPGPVPPSAFQALVFPLKAFPEGVGASGVWTHGPALPLAPLRLCVHPSPPHQQQGLALILWLLLSPCCQESSPQYAGLLFQVSLSGRLPACPSGSLPCVSVPLVTWHPRPLPRHGKWLLSFHISGEDKDLVVLVTSLHDWLHRLGTCCGRRHVGCRERKAF